MWIISGLHVDHMLEYISGLYVDYKWVTCGLYVMLENNHMDYMRIIVDYM